MLGCHQIHHKDLNASSVVPGELHGALDAEVRPVELLLTSLATRKASSGLLTSPSLPGTVGTPAACNTDGICGDWLNGCIAVFEKKW